MGSSARRFAFLIALALACLAPRAWAQVGNYQFPPIGNIATWTTVTRPGNPPLGATGYNRTTGSVEIWNGSAWQVNAGCAFGSTAGTCVPGNGGTIGGALTITGALATQGTATLGSSGFTYIDTHILSDLIANANSNAVGVGVLDELVMLASGGTIPSGHAIAHFSIFNNNQTTLTIPLGIADECAGSNVAGGTVTTLSCYISHLLPNAGTIGTWVDYDTDIMDSNAGGTVTTAINFRCRNYGTVTGTVTNRICLENDDPLKEIYSAGQIFIDDASPLVLNGANNTTRYFNVDTAASLRWQFGADQVIESGANVGSDFAILNYADNGTLIGVPLIITRASGLATWANGVVVSAGGLNVTGGYKAAGTAGVTCSGTPTASFAVTSGIVTHC